MWIRLVFTCGNPWPLLSKGQDYSQYFLFTVVASTKTFSFNCITILTIFTPQIFSFLPRHTSPPPSRPHSLASTSRLCVCLRFVSFFSAALFLVSTQSWLALKLHNLSASCFLELPHTGLIIILTATLIGEM